MAKIWTIFLLVLPVLGFSQSWKQLWSLNLRKPITSVSTDNQQQIYLGTAQGDVYRLQEDGSEDMHFSDIGNASVTTIETSNRLKVFLFYRDLQQITILDRFTTTPINYNISSFQQDLAWLMSPGTDNSIWMLSSAFNELRKYNIQTKELILATPLSIDLKNASHLVAFQNLVIISDTDEGLFFFDQFGNPAGQLNISGIQYFTIRNGRLAALCADGILEADPFNPTSYKIKKAPEGAFSEMVVIGDTYVFIDGKTISAYALEL